jgi:hypothetical protein
LETSFVEKDWTEAERLRHWRGVIAERRKRRRVSTVRWGLAFAAAVVAITFVHVESRGRTSIAPLSQVGPSGAVADRRLERVLPGGDLLGLTASTQYTFEDRDLANGGSERHVFLTQGELLAQVVHRAAGQRFVVETPHLTITVVGTRFVVTVTPSKTHVRVEEGRVRVDARTGASLFLSAGEEIDSDDPRLRPPTEDESKLSQPAEVQQKVLPARRVHPFQAKGDDLTAQTALQALAQQALDAGRIDEAIRYWDKALARFPDGVFAPEARLGLIDAWRRLGRYSEARDSADAFIQRYPNDPRAAEVIRVRQKLK